MDSTVKVCLFSFLIGFATAAIDPGCQFVGEFCDPEDSQADLFKLSDLAVDMATATDECYDECNLQKADPTSPCLSFTVRQVGLRPPTCYLLRSACVLNSADACLGSMPDPSCVSGPSDCASFAPTLCPKVEALDGDYARWQCQDINTDPINPYKEEVPEGTVCYQTCSSWVSEEGVDGPPGQLVSTCDAGVWTAPVNSDPSIIDGALFYPAFPDGIAYPPPDAIAADALPCGCQPLEVQWPYDGPGVDPLTQIWYDPNREEAAEFICETTVNMDNLDYKIETTNTCVLYCDDHYVATATCLDGEWTGNPEWGFWCYEEPEAIA